VLIAIGLVIGVPLIVASLALAAYTIWLGVTVGAWHFITRGIGILVIALLAGRAATTLLPVRALDATKPVPVMLDLAMDRGRRTLTVIRLGLCSCLVAAAFGLAGTALRSSLASPPRLSPVVDLLIVGAGAAGLALWGRHVKATLGKLQALRGVLAIQSQE
jgi:hypothetical protein